MNTYAPPFKLTNTMLDLVASISEKVGRITTGKNLESKPHLRKNNRVKSIYSSLKIEANSLTIGQVRDVIDGKLVLGEQNLLQSEGQREGISEYVKRLLDVMEYEVPYTAVTLMELLGLRSKESFRKNYLNPAIELQLIRMTVPDKPRSRNQRYVKR